MHNPYSHGLTRISRKKQKFAFMYNDYFPFGLMHECSKFVYEWEKQMLCFFECAKI